MATNYDPEADDFASAVEMENYDYANSAKPSEHQLHGVETHPDQQSTKMQFVRTGHTTRDLIFTDIGKFQIAIDHIPDPGIVGELWVAYTFRLSRANVLSSVNGASQEFSQFAGTGNGATDNTPDPTVTAVVPVSGQITEYEIGDDSLFSQRYTRSAFNEPLLARWKHGSADCFLRRMSANVFSIMFPPGKSGYYTITMHCTWGSTTAGWTGLPDVTSAAILNAKTGGAGEGS